MAAHARLHHVGVDPCGCADGSGRVGEKGKRDSPVEPGQSTQSEGYDQRKMRSDEGVSIRANSAPV